MRTLHVVIHLTGRTPSTRGLPFGQYEKDRVWPVWLTWFCGVYKSSVNQYGKGHAIDAWKPTIWSRPVRTCEHGYSRTCFSGGMSKSGPGKLHTLQGDMVSGQPTEHVESLCSLVFLVT